MKLHAWLISGALMVTGSSGVRSLAADKSGVSPNSISVPKGPGSIEGLGESFQPSLNTGTAKYGLGLKLPPGVAGHQPGLGLSYEGGGGNGPLGFGWHLSLPYIQRRTDKGIPTYGADVGFARSDVFINEMKEELVPRADGYCFCENEGAFIRYRQVGDHWEGTAPDGSRMEFGLTSSGRVQDGTNGARVFCWMLEKETDTRGNTILYTYSAFSGAQNTNQKYLLEIRYGPGAPPWENFHFARFAYEDRADWFEDGRAGFLVRTGKRLKSIFIGSQGAALNGHLAGDFNGDGTTDYLNRRYDLAYLRYAGTNSHWSLLDKVTLVGADGVTSLPPAAFSYAVSNPPDELSAQGHIWGAIDEPFAVMDNQLAELVDLNADGLPDMLKTESGGGAHTVSINRGPVQQAGKWAIQWAAPVAVDPGTGTAWNFDLASGQTHLADMDGDGLADLVHKSADDAVFFFANRGKLAWGARQEMALQESAPPAPFGAPDVRTADVDFDKRIDIIQSVDVGNGIAYRVWFNLGNQTYSSPITIESSGGFAFSVSGVQIADCNGDRVPDIARIQPGAVVVAAGLGYGRFAEPLALVLPDLTLDDLQIAKAKLTDINGDGLADLVIERASPGECWYWLNLGNYTFSSRKRIVDLPAAFSVNTAVRWADLNGNGTVDLVYSDSQAVPRIQMVEVGEILGGGLMPNLLTRIENGIGAVTQIEYAPSTKFALDDTAAGRPWPDILPFPVTVVAGVTVSDSLGHEYTTRFRYHDGFYDPVEKQFRGFARAEQVDVGDPTAPTLISRSSFDTGRDFDAMKGRLLRSSVETEDGRVFSEETTTWANPPRTLMVGTNGLVVRYAHPVASVKQILELGRGAPRRLESEMDYDQFGNQTRAANYGIVENGDRTAFDDERITLTEYAINTNAWILRAPKRQVVQDKNGAVISRTESFYDDETFSGANSGEVNVGNLTLARVWIDPSKPVAFINAARTKFDRYGNAVMTMDPLANASGGAIDLTGGHVREVAYDDRFHTYAIQETIHVGQGREALVFRAEYDAGLGTMTLSSDFNQNETRYVHDVFARQIQFFKPGDSPDYPSTEYGYFLAVPFGPGGLVNFVETRQLDRTPATVGTKRDHYVISRQFSDGLGRPLMTRSEAEPAPGQTAPRVIVSGAVLFNARQKPVETFNPFFTLQSGSLDELLAFENIEAPGWSGQFHENGSLVTLNLASAHKSRTESDATLRVVQATNPDGTRVRTEYEPLVTRAFDENDTDPASPHFNTPMVHASDGLGRLIRVEEIVRLNDDGTPSDAVKTWTTRYEYDLNNALTRVIDSRNNVKLMRYDGLKRRTFMNDTDCGIINYKYDDASNLIETVDAKGQRITFTYDGINRMLTEDYLDENSTEFSYHRSPDVIYHYDAPAPSVEQGDGTRATARNTKGVLAYVEDASGESHTSFDARGRVEWSVKRIVDPFVHSLSAPGGEANLISYKTAFEYDSSDRVTRTIYPDNDQISYEYNARNLPRRIAGGPSGSIISAIDYLPSAQESRFDYGNGVRTTYAYDSRLRLTGLNTLSPPTGGGQGKGLIDFTYDLDAASNIETIHDQRAAVDLALTDPRRNTQVFTYDDLYRLTRVQYNASSVNAPSSTNLIRYRYDRLGNMLTQTSDIAHFENGRSVTDVGTMAYGGAAGGTNRVGRQPGEPPGPHALTAIQNSASSNQHRIFPYDAGGNMIEIDGLRCTWDFNDRLVAVEDESMRAEYLYDYTGRRITKRVVPKNALPASRGEVTIYVTTAFEIRDYEQPTKYVFNGATRVARITGSLSTNTRIQRFHICAGWNLVSLAVTAPNALRQLTNFQSVVRWNQPTLGWLPISPDETLPAGTVLWLRAVTNATLTVTGHYAPPTNQPITTGGSFHASVGFEVVPLLGEGGGLRADLALWRFNSARQKWSSWLPSIPSVDPGFPEVLAPGSAFFVQAGTPSELAVPDAALQIRYYHQDHLGSSSVMTDAGGAIVEETSFYPFGAVRHKHSPRQISDAYQFTQKERDRESGFDYFEARYLAGNLSRFLSVDPKYANIEGAVDEPQALNLYAYVRNSPLRYIDPSGCYDLDYGAEGAPDLNVIARTFADPEAARLGEAYQEMAAFVPNAIKDTIAGVIGINTANAPGFNSDGSPVKTYDSLSYGDQAKTIIAAVGGGKLVNTGVQLLGKALGAQSASMAKRGVDAFAKTEADALAKTRPDALATTQPGAPFAKTQSMGGTQGSRGSGVGEVRTPARSGSSSIRSVADDAANAIEHAKINEFQAILKVQQQTLWAVSPASKYNGTALDMAFKQANAIWVGKYGTPPPGNLGGKFTWGGD